MQDSLQTQLCKFIKLYQRGIICDAEAWDSLIDAFRHARSEHLTFSDRESPEAVALQTEIAEAGRWLIEQFRAVVMPKSGFSRLRTLVMQLDAPGAADRWLEVCDAHSSPVIQSFARWFRERARLYDRLNLNVDQLRRTSPLQPGTRLTICRWSPRVRERRQHNGLDCQSHGATFLGFASWHPELYVNAFVELDEAITPAPGGPPTRHLVLHSWDIDRWELDWFESPKPPEIVVEIEAHSSFPLSNEGMHRWRFSAGDQSCVYPREDASSFSFGNWSEDDPERPNCWAEACSYEIAEESHSDHGSRLVSTAIAIGQQLDLMEDESQAEQALREIRRLLGEELSLTLLVYPIWIRRLRDAPDSTTSELIRKALPEMRPLWQSLLICTLKVACRIKRDPELAVAIAAALVRLKERWPHLLLWVEWIPTQLPEVKDRVAE